MENSNRPKDSVSLAGTGDHHPSETQRRFATILAGMEDGYFEVNLGGDFTLFNDSMCRIVGFQSHELMGMNFRHYVKRDTVRKVIATFRQVHQTRRGAEAFDWKLTRKDGEVRHVSTSVSLVLDEQGLAVGFRGIARDVTDRKRAADEITQKARQLQEANTALSVLLKRREEDRAKLETRMQHNIDTLLRPHLEAMAATKLSEQQRGHLRMIQANLDEMLSPFVDRLSATFTLLTPKEIEVAAKIRTGKTSKEIAALMGISPKAVQFHRNSIRGKLGLTGRKINLRSYLLSLSRSR